MNLKAQWQAWGQRIALLSQRERVLILLTGLVLLGAAGLYGWIDGADTRLQQDRMALSAAERDLEIMELENLGKQARLKRDPNQGFATSWHRSRRIWPGSTMSSRPRPSI